MITSTKNRRTMDTAMALAFLLAALMAATLLAAKPGHAKTFTVDRNDDPDPTTAKECTDTPNDCSLRGAIVAANAAAGPDDITVPAGTYTLTRAGDFEDAASTGDLDIIGELTITGAGARATSVAGGAAPYNDRIFDNRSGATATITGLTVTGGKPGAYEGGGVRNQGDLTLDGVAVEGNESEYAGGIYSEGTLNITDSVVSGNSAEGVGGVSHYSGTANITNTTISGNKTAGVGGGLYASVATVNIVNSTIASNESIVLNGILTVGPGTAVIVKNTIVSGNPNVCGDYGALGGVIRSLGNNISTDASCGFTKTGDRQNTNPRLGPLADNGGPTDTRALLSGSPAIDAGTNAGCPATDQRGVKRPQGLRCDIGAFELPNNRPVANNDSYRGVEDKVLKVGASGVLRNDRDPDGDRLSASVVSRPKKGTLSLGANGSFTYKPKRDANGVDRFVYRAGDGRGGTDTATATIRIRPVRG